MKNCGIDIIEISRIEDAIKKNPAFLEKVFSREEIEYFNEKGRNFQSLAGFFAAKEAFSKYMGTGISGFKLCEISVGHKESGEPFLSFRGKKMDVSLSISHNKTTAVAVVCGTDDFIETPLKDEMKKLLPKREKNSNKGDFGRVLVIAGSCGMTGAAVLSAYSALRTGSGLVTLATADSERSIAAGFHPEIMTYGLCCENGIIKACALRDILKLSRDKDAVVFGPGIGQSNELIVVLEELMKNYTGKLLVDADGLNILAKRLEMLSEKTCKIVLTPHPGEMSRLTGLSVDEIQKNRKAVAWDFAKRYGVCLVLKGYETVVAEKDREVYINQTGNPGMATAGTGDVLSGVIASLMGQGLECFDASRLGVYIHGLAGDLAKNCFGEYGMVASDVMSKIPEVIRYISK
ncbi:MAG: NAD(P)H-hydrate dehydratase [Clostridia bacterium]|nr:NAD(P)H-hydrate dehydratase [Clostridia bacterium]